MDSEDLIKLEHFSKHWKESWKFFHTKSDETLENEASASLKCRMETKDDQCIFLKRETEDLKKLP